MLLSVRDTIQTSTPRMQCILHGTHSLSPSRALRLHIDSIFAYLMHAVVREYVCV